MQERDRAIPGEAQEGQGCLREACYADSSPPGAITVFQSLGEDRPPHRETCGRLVGRKGRAENSYTC